MGSVVLDYEAEKNLVTRTYFVVSVSFGIRSPRGFISVATCHSSTSCRGVSGRRRGRKTRLLDPNYSMLH